MEQPSATRSLAAARLLGSSRTWRFDEREPSTLEQKLGEIGIAIPSPEAQCLGRDLRGGDFFTSEKLLRSFHAVLKGEHVAHVVDPWTFDGLLAASLVESGVADTADIVSIRPDSLARYVTAAFGLVFHEGHGWHWLRRAESPLTAVVSALPWNLKYTDSPRSNRPTDTEGLHDVAQLIMLETARRLAPDGIGVFAVAPSAVFRGSEKFRKLLSDSDSTLDALIYLPRDTFAPFTALQGAIAVIRRGRSAQTFVGAFDGTEGRDATVVENWRKRLAGSSPSAGTLVDLETFSGLEALEAAERSRALASQMRVPMRRVADIVTSRPVSTRATDAPGFDEVANAIYLPKIGRGPAVTSPAEFRMKPHNYLQLLVDTMAVDPSYLAKYFSTPIGQSAREAQLRGATIPRLTTASALDVHVYLPDLGTQQRMLATSDQLSSVIGELTEAEARLWVQPQTVATAEALVKQLSRPESYTEWLDRLPFPLATILWAHKTEERDDRRAYEHLLHFFEALAEFLASILISAARRAPELLGEKRLSAITESMQSGRVSLTIGTFGTWKHLFGFLAKQFRPLMSGTAEKRERLAAALGTHDDAVLTLLTSREIVTILEKANSMRNAAAHGGVVSERDAGQRHDAIRALVTETRRVFGRAWDSYELIAPKSSRLRNGTHFVTVQRVTGRASKFEQIEIELSGALEEGQLHLHSPGEPSALPLVPFVRVMPSPRTEANACYFYSRESKGLVRFVSYHFEQEAEVEELAAATAQLIAELTSGL